MARVKNQRSLSRRATLRLGTIGAGFALAGGLLAACGSSDDTSTAASKVQTVSAAKAGLAPFDPNAKAGPPTGLPKRVAWANVSNAEFFLSLGSAIKDAAKTAGCDYVTAVADNDAAKNVDQMNQFIARGIGAMVVQPLDPASQTPVMQSAIDKGVGVMGLITSPTTMVAVTDQYGVGLAQGKAAAAYIKAKLGGKAQVQVFNEDSLGPPLKQRHKGVLDGLKTGGAGVEVVSDIEAKKLTNDGGFQTMNTVIQAHPDIKVVLGVDTEVIGAYRALQQAGKATDDMYLSGINGDQQALDLIAKGGPYKASWAFAWPVLGYTIGKYSCDWINGKSIPRALVVPAVPLDSAAAISTYDADMKQPAAIFADDTSFHKYITPKGNISFQTKTNFWKQTYTP
jgi:ribose transport system substrate-binding protein